MTHYHQSCENVHLRVRRPLISHRFNHHKILCGDDINQRISSQRAESPCHLPIAQRLFMYI